MTTRANRDVSALLELIACPICQGTLRADGETFRCDGSGHRFGRRGEVPMLMAESTTGTSPSRIARLQYALLSNPRLYDLQQKYGGARPIAAQVAAALGNPGRSTLLDIGAGTGMVAALVPPETRYVWLDNDLLKLRGFLSKSIDCMAVIGDASRLPFRDRIADVSVMVEVSHHLPDDVLHACFAEAARVTRDRFIFVDALRGTRLRSKLLWQLDLGRFPRGEPELVGALSASFDVQEVRRFRVNHDHLVCFCVPKR